MPPNLNAVTHAVQAVDKTGVRDVAAAETYDDRPDGVAGRLGVTITPCDSDGES